MTFPLLHKSIGPPQPEVEYYADGNTAVWHVPFPYLRPSDIGVKIIDAEGLETVLAIGVDYALSGQEVCMFVPEGHRVRIWCTAPVKPGWVPPPPKAPAYDCGAPLPPPLDPSVSWLVDSIREIKRLQSGGISSFWAAAGEAAEDAKAGFKAAVDEAREASAQAAGEASAAAAAASQTAQAAAESARDAAALSASSASDAAETAGRNAESTAAAAETVETAMSYLYNDGVLGYATKALLDADLAHPANTLAFVTNDPTDANNGWYIKTGASGEGAWTASDFAPATDDDLDALWQALKRGRAPSSDVEGSWFLLFADPRHPDVAEIYVDGDERIFRMVSVRGDILDTARAKSLFLDGEFPLWRTAITDSLGRIIADDKSGSLRFYAGNGDTQFLSPQDKKQNAVVVDEHDNILQAVDEQGIVSFPGDVRRVLPYIVDGDLYAAVGDDSIQVAPQLRGWSFLAAFPQNAESVRSVAARDGQVRKFSATVDGYSVPDADPAVLHIFVVVGQSLCIGANGQPLITPYPPLDGLCLMFAGDAGMDIRMGLNTASSQTITNLDPQSLTGFQNVFSRTAPSTQRGQTLAESLGYRIAECEIRSGHAWRSLWIVSGVGGTTYNGMKRGTVPYNNTLTAVARAVELAAMQGMSCQVEAIIQKHGESDSGNSNYYNCLMEWQSDYETDLQAITGQAKSIPMILSMPSSFANATHSIQAMLDAHLQSPKHWLVCADYPAPYSDDYLHLSGPGYHILGETMAQAVLQVAFFGSCDCVRMTGATRTGTTVTVAVNVPVPPLVLDTVQVPERSGTVKGFTYYSGDVQIGITSVAITDAGADGTATVTLTLAEVPGGDGQEAVCYAWDPQTSPRTVDAIPRGNLRDSAGERKRSSYDGRRLDNWAVHQRQIVTIEGD